MCREQEYTLTENAKEYAGEYFHQLSLMQDGKSANARDVRNFMENAITRQASRLIKLKSPTRDELLSLEAEDFMPISEVPG